jgi:ferredoxin-nitrite reductase
MKFSVAAIAASVVLSSAFAFTPISVNSPSTTRVFSAVEDTETAAGTKFEKGPIIVDKPTGTSFLPEDTVARCEKGNPTEKAKLKKDPINAWVDVYEYARKIREGEMTWDEVEKADLDTVGLYLWIGRFETYCFSCRDPLI